MYIYIYTYIYIYIYTYIYIYIQPNSSRWTSSLSHLLDEHGTDELEDLRVVLQQL